MEISVGIIIALLVIMHLMYDKCRALRPIWPNEFVAFFKSYRPVFVSSAAPFTPLRLFFSQNEMRQCATMYKSLNRMSQNSCAKMLERVVALSPKSLNFFLSKIVELMERKKFTTFSIRVVHCLTLHT